MTEEQVDFMLWSDLLDDPKAVAKLDSVYYDPEYDKAFDELDNSKEPTKDEGELGSIMHKFSHNPCSSSLDNNSDDNFFESSTPTDIEQNRVENDEDWEEV